MKQTKGMVPDKSKCCVTGVSGATFMSKKPVVVQRPHGHLERPPSQELAVGLPGKIRCDEPKSMGKC